jgi:hypothetical protein
MVESLAGAIKFYKTRFNIWLNEGRVRAMHFVQDETKNLEARVGFEPTNGGFADLSLGPLGYRAELLSIAKLAQTPGVAASVQSLWAFKIQVKQALCASSAEASR